MSVVVSAVKAVKKVKALFLPLVWKSDKDRVCSCPLVSCHVPQMEKDTLVFKYVLSLCTPEGVPRLFPFCISKYFLCASLSNAC